MFVEVAVNIPSDKTFTYAVPAGLRDRISPGLRVLVPFGKKKITGYILDVLSGTERREVKEILDVLDREPLFNPDDLKFFRWAAEYYFYPLGKAIAEVLPAPPEIRPRRDTFVSLKIGAGGETALSKKEKSTVQYLAERGETSLSELRRQLRITPVHIHRLAEKGVVDTVEKEVYRQAVATTPVARDSGRIELNDAQKTALEEVVGGLRSGKFSPCLLHGVTGSGKTEVYLRALEETIRLGGSAIFLVPEIGLTPQLLTRINERFRSEDVVALHSGVSRTLRYDGWRKIARGEVRVAVGARSAVFAPARDLKLIIVDEEHDGSYKQDERMRYNARDLAIVKARLHDATIVLGSATPGLQTFFNARSGKYRHLVLPDRAGDRPLPGVEILDMRREKEERGGGSVLSLALRSAIEETLGAGKQTLLFLNRRGFHTFLFCADCGHVLRCLNCSVSMTHHAGEGTLRCHYCDYALKAPPLCPACRSGRVRSYGAGTERVEDELSRTFPGARIARMDSDTTVRRGSQERILQGLERGDIDILVGTQMITKGHDYPNVLLVGVIMADASLNIPDFRAAEHTFQLLTQVSGRGGRGDDPGRVIIQTFNPGHYAVRLAKEHDYLAFYEEEVALRQTIGYPPFVRMINLQLSGINKDRAEEGARRTGEAARRAVAALKGKGGLEVLGPAEAPIAKLKGRHRWQILLKGKSVRVLHALAKDLVEGNREKGLEIRVDVDPLNFM